MTFIAYTHNIYFILVTLIPKRTDYIPDYLVNLLLFQYPYHCTYVRTQQLASLKTFILSKRTTINPYILNLLIFLLLYTILKRARAHARVFTVKRLPHISYKLNRYILKLYSNLGLLLWRTVQCKVEEGTRENVHYKSVSYTHLTLPTTPYV